jgi:hypothetical protein
MSRAVFRFYGELNDFLPPKHRQCDIEYSFQNTPAVKDAIEALGVPHTEVDLIVVNGQSVGFRIGCATAIALPSTPSSRA